MIKEGDYVIITKLYKQHYGTKLEVGYKCFVDSASHRHVIVEGVALGVEQVKRVMTPVKFDAELWIYQRKSAYPDVKCIRGGAEGLWENFGYHPKWNGKVLQHGDSIYV